MTRYKVVQLSGPGNERARAEFISSITGIPADELMPRAAYENIGKAKVPDGPFFKLLRETPKDIK